MGAAAKPSDHCRFGRSGPGRPKSFLGAVLHCPRLAPLRALPAMSSDVAEEKTGSEPALDKAPSFKRTRRPTTPPKTHSIAPPTVPPMFGSLIKLGHRMPTWKERHFVLVRG